MKNGQSDLHEPTRAELCSAMGQLRHIAENHPDEDATVTPTVAAKLAFDEEGNYSNIIFAYNRVPRKLSAVFKPLTQLLGHGVAFKESAGETIPPTLGKSSATRHAETDLKGSDLCQQAFCPHCAAYIVLSGQKKIWLDVKALENEFMQRRGDIHFRKTLEILRRSGAQVRTIAPEAEADSHNILWMDGHDVTFDPGQTFWMMDLQDGADLTKPWAIPDVKENVQRLKAQNPFLNKFVDYTAVMTGYRTRDQRSQRYSGPFVAICLATLPPGFSYDTYVSEGFQHAENTDPNTKYTLPVPPISAADALLARNGIEPVQTHIWTIGAVPTMRDLINNIRRATRTITICTPDAAKISTDIADPAKREIKDAFHKKAGQPYQVFNFYAAIYAMQTCLGHDAAGRPHLNFMTPDLFS